MGISYKKGSNTLIGYSDAEFASDGMTRHSASGYTFNYAGGAISRRIKRPMFIAQSTMESEYITPSDAARKFV